MPDVQMELDVVNPKMQNYLLNQGLQIRDRIGKDRVIMATSWLQKISAGYYGFDQYYNGYWVTPDGEIFDLEDTHHAWIYQNIDLLRNKYGIDINEWIMGYREKSMYDEYESLREEFIKDIAWKQEIDESQVVLTEEQEEEIQNSVSEFAEEPNGVELVDYLIQHEWIRVSQKNNNIHIEAKEDSPGFWDRAEMIMIKLFPKVWSNPRYMIAVNNDEISSEDLQRSGNLRSAIAQESNYSRSYRWLR